MDTYITDADGINILTIVSEFRSDTSAAQYACCCVGQHKVWETLGSNYQYGLVFKPLPLVHQTFHWAH